MSAAYKPNRRFLDNLARSADVSRVSVAAAERGAAWARSNAPVDSGEYKSSFRVEAVTVRVGGKPRSGANLVNDATRQQGGRDYPYAFAVEWGKGGEHVLARAVDIIENG